MTVSNPCPACNEEISFEVAIHHVYPLRSGLTIRLEDRTDWCVIGEIFINQLYAGALDKVKFPPGKLRAVDLGSNVGYFSLWLADQLIQRGQDFKIECIDVSRRNCETFSSRFSGQTKRSTTPSCEMSLRHGAVGLRSGSVQMYEDTTGFHAKDCLIAHLESAPKEMVNYVDLDEVIAPGPIHLCKVDIEGSEEDFCKTYSNSFLRRVGVCVMEIHEWKCDVDKIMQAMKFADFTHCDRIWHEGNVSLWVWWR